MIDINSYLFFILSFFAIILLISFFAIKKPIISLYVLLSFFLIDAIIPYEQNSNSPSFMFEEFVFIIFLLLITIKFLSDISTQTYTTKIFLPIILFLVWSLLIGYLVSFDKLRVLTYWKNYFAGFWAFFIVIFYLNTKQDFKNFYLFIIIWGFIFSIILILITISLGGFSKGILGLFLKKNLLNVSWGKSNYLATFLVILICASFGYLFITKSYLVKILMVINLISMFFAITLTLSRGGILSLIITLFFMVAPKLIKPKYFISLILLVFIIILIAFLNPLTSVLIERILSLEESLSLYSRINYYKDVWRTFLENPFIGVGFGNLGYYATFVLSPWESPSTHNIILGMLGETGIIGAILFILIFVIYFNENIKSYLNEKDEKMKMVKWFLITSAVAGLLNSMVEPNFEGFQFSILYWSLLGLSYKVDLLT